MLFIIESAYFLGEATVRSTNQQINIIKQLFSDHFLPPNTLWLFGSRVDGTRKGGDIDLYIETYSDDVAFIARRQIAFLAALKMQRGDQKIDLVINRIKSGLHLPICDSARKNGIQLL